MGNMILKRGSNLPPYEQLIMLRMIAIENLFRMSLMYLKKNLKALREAMDENLDQLDENVVTKHKKMMNKIIKGMYPKGKGKTGLENFKQLETWLGHDLLVNVIASYGKAGGGDEIRFRVFEKNRPEKEWKAFEASEAANGRHKPSREAKYTEPEYKDATNTKAKSRNKRLRGKCYS
jgi:hypothetical protein